LFQVLNFGNKSDEIKFVFSNSKSNTSIIHNKNTGIQAINDVINKYGESTYHSDGSFFYKFPNYPENKQYNNPHGEGMRRTPLDQIAMKESLFHYEVFRYQLCRKKKTIPAKEKISVQNEIFFDGTPFGCIIMLINKRYSFYETSNREDKVFIRLKGITDNLDLGIVFGKLTYKGHTIYDESLGKNIFTDNNHIQIVEDK